MRGDEGRKLPPAAAATRSTNRTLSDMLSCDKLINRFLLYIFSPSRIDVMIYSLEAGYPTCIHGDACWMMKIESVGLPTNLSCRFLCVGVQLGQSSKGSMD